VRFLAIVLVVLTADPRAALAQSVGSALFPGDASASIGWFAADRSEPGSCCAGWSSSLLKGAGAGYYWTDHLKTELDLSWPGRTESFSYSANPQNAAVSPVAYDLHSYKTFKMSGSQLYQFGQNAFVHPFVGAGVDVDSDRDDITRTTQFGRTVSEIRLTEHETHVKPFVTTGIKAYFSERVFFRTDVKVAFSDQVDQFVWRSGVGVDLGRPRTTVPTRANVRSEEPKDADARQESPEVWRAYAAKLPIGSAVKVASRGGRGFVASLIAVDDTGIVVKPRSRVPEPLRHVPFDDLERLHLEDGTSSNHGVVVAAAIGAGVGAFFLLLLAAMAAAD